MKKFFLFSPLFSPLIAAVLTLSTPAIAFAHVGHGDEFQATQWKSSRYKNIYFFGRK